MAKEATTAPRSETVAMSTYQAPTLAKAIETMAEMKHAYLHEPVLIPSLLSNEKNLISDRTPGLRMFLEQDKTLWLFIGKERCAVPSAMVRNALAK